MKNYVLILMASVLTSAAQTPTEMAQAVDRMARPNQGIYDVDYSFGVTSRPSREEAKEMTAEQRRATTQWGITLWDANKLGPQPSQEDIIAAAQTYVRVPPRVSPRQLRLALINQGILPEQVGAAIDAIEDPTARARAQAEWDHATFYDRTNPTVNALGQLLGLSTQQIDQLFIAAALF